MSDFIYNDKALDVIAACKNPKVRQITAEGSIRSGKTADLIEGFHWRCFYSEGFYHAICSKDNDTLDRNILDGNGIGLLTRFASKYQLVRPKIGAAYLEMTGYRGVKKHIILATYGNRSKWTKVLGGTIENFFIDEANIADPQFINECYARQATFSEPLTIYTLNGDIPTAEIYSHINPSKIIGKCPSGIRAEMDKCEKKKGYYYFHFTMEDNPVMTPEKIAAAKTLYPVGSYYYTIKILGERGAPGELIYIDYIDEGKLIQSIDTALYHSFIVSMDVGATRATSSLTLIGFLPNYKGAAIVSKKTFRQAGYEEKTNRLKEFIREARILGARNIECVIIDSAEQNFIADLRTVFARDSLPVVIGSYKSTIKERIDLVCLLMARGKLKFNDTAEGKAALLAFKQASWKDGKRGEERKDENEEWNDILDSIEYGLTRHMKALLKSATEETGV